MWLCALQIECQNPNFGCYIHANKFTKEVKFYKTQFEKKIKMLKKYDFMISMPMIRILFEKYFVIILVLLSVFKTYFESFRQYNEHNRKIKGILCG